MKKLFSFAIVLAISLTFFSCNKDELEKKHYGFDESVAIIQHGLNNMDPTKSIANDSIVLTIEIKSFDSEFKLESQYNIDSIQYSDDGEFNDELAGDGVFSSIHAFSFLNNKNIIEEFDKLNLSKKFKFEKEMNSFLKDKYGSDKAIAVRYGCKMRIVTCAETTWYNSCWPLSSPCSCVEFYDCGGSWEFSLGL